MIACRSIFWPQKIKISSSFTTSILQRFFCWFKWRFFYCKIILSTVDCWCTWIQYLSLWLTDCWLCHTLSSAPRRFFQFFCPLILRGFWWCSIHLISAFDLLFDGCFALCPRLCGTPSNFVGSLCYNYFIGAPSTLFHLWLADSFAPCFALGSMVLLAPRLLPPWFWWLSTLILSCWFFLGGIPSIL